MMKHTPGPWRLRADMAVMAYCDETETHEPIARAYGDGSIENLHANSRLIASAPDLLAACKALLNCIQPDRDWDEAKKARVAIRKAEGQ